MIYKSRDGILRDCNLSMSQLAEMTYTSLCAEDKKKVDQFVLDLDAAFLEKRGGKAHGMGVMGLRELALALYIRAVQSGVAMDQLLIGGIQRKQKELNERTEG